MDSNASNTAHKIANMELQAFAGLAHSLQTLTMAAIVIAVCACIPTLINRAQLAKLPAHGGGSGEKHRQGFLHSAKEMYVQGFKKFKDRVYVVMNMDGENNVVIPPSLLPELRRLPDDVLNFPKAIDKVMEIKYTKIDTDGTLAIHAIKSDLTPALVRLNPTIAEEVDAAVRHYFPPCTDWTEVPVSDNLVNIIARVSGRVFVGTELCQDPEYLNCAVNYTLQLMHAIQAIKTVRPILRPFLAPRVPELKKLRDMEARAKEYLEPMILERIEAEANDPNWQKPDDMMQWLLNRRHEHGNFSTAELVKTQLNLTFAAIHTTNQTATNVIYTLAVTPEYIQPLREEIRNAMADNGGIITSRALQQMVKLDSYIKEVTRLYPPGITSFTRRVLKGITLSNGQYIPPGVVIEVPTHAIYTDPDTYTDSDKFDGFRHAKLREGGTASDNARNQFVVTNEMNLAFGYGKHACPGRFFAANEIKMIIARLVLDFDVRMPNGETERYPQLEFGKQSMPQPGKTLTFKRV